MNTIIKKTPIQTTFWLKKKGFFVKKIAKPEVFTHSERLVYVYLQKNNNQHFLIIAYHHIALDGWSAQLLREEIFRRYAGEHILQIPLQEELDSLNKVQEIHLPLPQAMAALEHELKPIIFEEYVQTHSLYNETIVNKKFVYFNL